MRARTKAPAAPGSVFDNFPLFYVQMFLILNDSISHHIGYTSSALHFPVYSSA